jgi:hypothetical protein
MPWLNGDIYSTSEIYDYYQLAACSTVIIPTLFSDFLLVYVTIEVE